LHGWNEISGRYVEMYDVYRPMEWRAQSKDSKQGSEGLVAGQAEIQKEYNEVTDRVLAFYHKLCDLGVAKEQARCVLPFGTFTECVWTVSFQAVMNFLDLRLDEHAQYEIRVYARAIQELVRESVPVLFQCWQETNSI
jgi:thymidylate synthase (FAD)